ncbi:MAG: hypothetical protein ABIQ99_03945 [Thermoflexales bacterium]
MPSEQAGAAGLKSDRWAQNRKVDWGSACFGEGRGVAGARGEALMAAGDAATDGAPIPIAGIITRLGNSDGGRWAAGTADDGPNGEAQLDNASAASTARERIRNVCLVIFVS